MYPTDRRHVSLLIPSIFLIAALGFTLTMTPASAVNVTSTASLGMKANDQTADGRVGGRFAGHGGVLGPAPAAGMCWYYSDPSRMQGSWDHCR